MSDVGLVLVIALSLLVASLALVVGALAFPLVDSTVPAQVIWTRSPRRGVP